MSGYFIINFKVRFSDLMLSTGMDSQDLNPLSDQDPKKVKYFSTTWRGAAGRTGTQASYLLG